MQMLFIVCETGVDYRVTKILEELDVPGYTRQSGFSGVGEGGKRGSHMAPGQNTLFISVMPDELAGQVCAKLKEFCESHEGRKPVALRVFSTPAQSLV